MDTMFASRYFGGVTAMIGELSQRKMRNTILGAHSTPRHITITVVEELVEMFTLRRVQRLWNNKVLCFEIFQRRQLTPLENGKNCKLEYSIEG